MTENQCVICAQQEGVQAIPSESGTYFNCPRCGPYKLAKSGYAEFYGLKPTERETANASSWLREHPSTVIESTNIKTIFKSIPPSIPERADKILIEIARNTPSLGDKRDIGFEPPINGSWLGISWSTNAGELDYLARVYLKEEKSFIRDDGNSRPFGLFGVYITPSGYARLDELRTRPINSQIGFCAMWFDSTLSELDKAISSATALAGYEPKRIDRHPHNQKIDDEIIAMIRRSKFVIADLTGQRGGVYFEAGFAMGLGREVIWTCCKDELDKHEIHFDTRQYYFVTWEPDKLSDFQERLHNRIEAIVGKGAWGIFA